MRKLVLGIIAVICLDVAFIVYPGIRYPGRIAYPAVNHEARNVAAIADQRAGDEIAVLSDDLDTGQTFSVDRKVPASRFRRDVSGNDQTSARTTNDRRLLNQQALFKPVVITVGHTNSDGGSFDRQPNTFERLKKDGPDDRSFVSTVMPIVKKPYELIKFIGSKLR